MDLKKILILLFFVFILSGCATYKFQKPDSAKAQGYLVSYDGKPLLEYTVGKDNSLPDLTLAEKRFKRRRAKVEYYYKKMGEIESRLKETFWNPPVMLVDLLGGVLRWPFTAVEDYKYNRDPKYKERVDKLDEQKDELEKSRVNALKEKLAAYIVEDLSKEPSVQKPLQQALVQQAPVLPTTQVVIPQPLAAVSIPTSAVEPLVAPAVEPLVASAVEPLVVPATEPVVTPSVIKEEFVAKPSVPPVVVAEPPVEVKPVVKETPVVKIAVAPPVAVIIAKPVKGYSPLKVNFSGQKSYSKSGNIVAYDWNFGDGDISNKKNPENTYWSTTYGPRNFTATLTVRDDAGNTSTANTIIEVTTK